MVQLEAAAAIDSDDAMQTLGWVASGGVRSRLGLGLPSRTFDVSDWNTLVAYIPGPLYLKREDRDWMAVARRIVEGIW